MRVISSTALIFLLTFAVLEDRCYNPPPPSNPTPATPVCSNYHCSTSPSTGCDPKTMINNFCPIDENGTVGQCVPDNPCTAQPARTPPDEVGIKLTFSNTDEQGCLVKIQKYTIDANHRYQLVGPETRQRIPPNLADPSDVAQSFCAISRNAGVPCETDKNVAYFYNGGLHTYELNPEITDKTEPFPAPEAKDQDERRFGNKPSKIHAN